MVKYRNHLKATKWPCGNCTKNCESSCIFCESCEQWYHSKCERICNEDLQSFSKIKENYICTQCRTCGSEFDYLFAMTRLQKAAEIGLQKLEDVARREALLLNETNDLGWKPQTVCDLEEDVLSTRFIERYTTVSNLKAAKSTGDGDCLFNAISILLTGDESMSIQLRYRCCLEMVLNKDQIKRTRDRASYNILSPTYEEAILDCAKIGSYSSVWPIIALSNVLDLPIRTVYPAINNSKHDLAVIKYNTCFYPHCDRTSLKPKEGEIHLTIMWTNTRSHTPGKVWSPNHFVPLVSPECVIPCINNYIPTKQSTPLHLEKPNIKRESDTHVEQSDEEVDNWALPSKRPRYSACDSFELSDSFESRNRFECLSDTESDQFPDEVHVPTMESALKDAPLTDKFMSNEKMIEILLNTQQPSKQIPVGRKNNKYIVIENNSDSRVELADDRGVWDSSQGTSNNQSFQINMASGTPQLKTLFRRDGKFVNRKRVNGVATYTFIDPQPSDNILTIHRYYAKLKHDLDYKKLVTTVTEAPKDLQRLKTVSLVEYAGTQTQNVRPLHGNSKHNKQPYIRTNPNTLKKCATKAVSKPATEVCYEESKDNSITGPRNAKQIRDKVYREKKKQSNNTTPNNNIADEILNIISQIHTNPYIQKIEISKHSLPNIILYSEDQLADMLSNCTNENGSVIGVDKTFNLGKCFVTCFSYKNLGVTHRDSKENPIMLGPIYLHWDSKEETYFSFFSHFMNKFKKGHNMKIGSDEETSITNNIKTCFPEATQLLCTKHIKDNIRHHLEKNGTCTRDREIILNIIFADGGIVHSKNDREYFARVGELDPYFQKYTFFSTYWEKHLKHKILKHVNEPLKNRKITSLWTNNNSESINNRMKQAADWKQHKLPELTDKLTNIINIQHLDLRRSIQGKGNFQIAQHLEHLTVDHDTWCTMTNTQKEEQFQKFLKQNKIRQTDKFNTYIASTKSTFSCPRPYYHMGKKPGQRRRARAERTSKFKT